MRTSFRALVALLSSAALVTLALPASATTEAPSPRCGVRVLPSAITTIPANAPALLFLDDSHAAVATVSSWLATPDGEGVSLPGPTTDALGTPIIPLTPGLEAGRTYDLRVAMQCSVPSTVPVQVSRFVGAEAMALPTLVGSLRSSAGTDMATIEVEPSRELAAYLPVSIVTLSVNGIVQHRVVGATDPTTLSLDTQTAGACRDSATGELRGGIGTADVTVTAHVAGAASDPRPATTRILVDCDAIASRLAPSPEPAGGSSGGCSASRARASGPGANAWALIGLALVALVKLRRR